jgi:hypothetical protein
MDFGFMALFNYAQAIRDSSVMKGGQMSEIDEQRRTRYAWISVALV